MTNREILSSSPEDLFVHLPLVQSLGFQSALFSSSLLLSAAVSASLRLLLAFLSFSLPLSFSLGLALVLHRSVALAGLAAHLSEVGPAAELELQYQRTVRHFVYIFAFWREEEEEEEEMRVHFNMF